MNFPIVIRNSASGMEKSFATLLLVAEFLATEVEPGDWTGHECLGPLPEVSAAPLADEGAPTDADDAVGEGATDSTDQTAAPAAAPAAKPAAPKPRASRSKK